MMTLSLLSETYPLENLYPSEKSRNQPEMPPPVILSTTKSIGYKLINQYWNMIAFYKK